MSGKIVQIIPASGVLAVFKDKDGEVTVELPVVCWALVEEEEEGEFFRQVVGMVLQEDFSGLVLVSSRDAGDVFMMYSY